MVKRFGIDQLSIEQRIALIEEIWRSIDARAVHVVLPTPAELAILQRQFGAEDDEDLFAFPPDRH